MDVSTPLKYQSFACLMPELKTPKKCKKKKHIKMKQAEKVKSTPIYYSIYESCLNDVVKFT